MDNEDDQSTFTSHLRTIIILAARNSPSGDIDIAAVDQIVETTIDFLKNILEQLPKESQRSVDDLFNIIRLNSHLIPNRKLFFSMMETINHL